MRLFDLYRIEDESGVSGTGTVAQGVEFDDGTIVMRWLTKNRSTAVYENETMLEAIHGHNGKTKVMWRDPANTFDRARLDCVQDRCENCPFASIGGLDKRSAMVAPSYIEGTYARTEYVRGYQYAARDIFGDDWETCSFGWAPALVVNGSDAQGEGDKR